MNGDGEVYCNTCGAFKGYQDHIAESEPCKRCAYYHDLKVAALAKEQREASRLDKIASDVERIAAALEHPQAGADQIKGDQCLTTSHTGAGASSKPDGSGSSLPPVDASESPRSSDSSASTGTTRSAQAERSMAATDGTDSASPSPNPVATSLRAACDAWVRCDQCGVSTREDLRAYGRDLASAALAAASEIERLETAVRTMTDNRDAIAAWKDRDAWKKRAEQAEAKAQPWGCNEREVVITQRDDARRDLKEAHDLIHELAWQLNGIACFSGWGTETRNRITQLRDKCQAQDARLDKRAAQGDTAPPQGARGDTGGSM